MLEQFDSALLVTRQGAPVSSPTGQVRNSTAQGSTAVRGTPARGSQAQEVRNRGAR